MMVFRMLLQSSHHPTWRKLDIPYYGNSALDYTVFLGITVFLGMLS